jgi:predicted ATPase/DNA-binding CsgD family transcriptional regulator
MAHSTPHVYGARLAIRGDATPIMVGTPAWYDWLQHATSFAFTSDAGHFTARKERRGQAGGYWRAYRRRQGHLYSVYLGKSPDLSLVRLQAAASTLDQEERASGAASSRAHRPPPAPTHPPLTPPQAHSTATEPGGSTVTFLLCALGDASVPASHDEQHTSCSAVFKRAVAQEEGNWLPLATPTLAAVFASPLRAVRAAMQCQRAWEQLQEPARALLPMRMALHTSVVTLQAASHREHALRLAEQLLASGNGSQLLLSHVTAELVRDQLAGDVWLHDLGSYTLGTASNPERVYQLVLAGVATDTSALSLPARRPHKLPHPLTLLVGREMDTAAVIASLQQPAVRLLTLTGPGGVGKTRLALAAATELREYFVDGIFFVDLAAFHSPERVAQQIAQTLGIVDTPRQPLLPRLCDYLARRSVLLLLDNVEQVRDLTPMLAELLGATPQVKILATSRAVLRLAGEHEYPVAPLSLPGTHAAANLDALGGYGAVRLFVERARAARPDFALTEQNAPAIAAICQRLDGLPLAIELAAVRCRLFSPDALLQRIERRLALLTGGAQDLPARQQTLRATLDWSYHLLDLSTQALLRRLAAFSGGFTLEAAEAVCCVASDEHDALVDGLAELVDQSLLQPSPAPGNAARFRMLETLHEYAAELLDSTDEAHALHDRHAAYFCQLAERAALVLEQDVDREWLDRLEAERANIRAALRWLLDHRRWEMAARFAAALAIYWDLRSARREGYDWIAAVLAHAADLSLPTRARTQYAAGYLARALYDREAATQLFAASVACYRALGDQRGLARALQSLAWTQANLGGDLAQTDLWLDESLRIARALDDTSTIGWALQCRGWIAQYQALGHTRTSQYLLQSFSWVERFPGSLAQARALHAESLAVRRAGGNPHSIAWSLAGLGLVAAAQGDIAAARTYEEERLAIERSLGNSYGVAETLRTLGPLALHQGDFATARTWLIECAALARDLGERYIALFALMTLGEVAYAEGDRARARFLFDEAMLAFTQTQDSRRLARLAMLRAQIALEDGDTPRARVLIAQSLAYLKVADDPALISFCLSSLADSAARTRNARWAAQLWGAAERQLEPPSVRYLPIEPNHRAQLQAQARTALGERAFAALWSAGRAMSPEAALELCSVSEPAEPQQLCGLTRRESEVLRLLSEGLANAEIAAQLVISPATVNTYLKAIYRKIGVSSRTAAMRFALDHLL